MKDKKKNVFNLIYNIKEYIYMKMKKMKIILQIKLLIINKQSKSQKLIRVTNLTT